MSKKSYKKFLNKAEATLDRPVSPVKVGEGSSSSDSGGGADWKGRKPPRVKEITEMPSVPAMATLKSQSRPNIMRASFITNQTDADFARKMYAPIHKSMNDPVQSKYELMGMGICVEWPAGKPRMYGKNLENEGKTSIADYGYIAGTTSPDGMEVDTYIGPHKNSNKVFLLMQKPTKWDVEHGITAPEEKWMLCFESLEQAKQCYMDSMPDEWFLSIGEVAMGDFEECIRKAKLQKAVDTEYEWYLLNQGMIEDWGIQKSNYASADFRTGFKQTQEQLLKYLEGEQSDVAAHQTDSTAELSPEPEVIGKSTRSKKRMELSKKLMEDIREPRPTSEGVMSRESERKFNRTPLVRKTRLVDAGQTSAIPLFPNRLPPTHKKRSAESSENRNFTMKSLMKDVIHPDDSVNIVFEI